MMALSPQMSWAKVKIERWDHWEYNSETGELTDGLSSLKANCYGNELDITDRNYLADDRILDFRMPINDGAYVVTQINAMVFYQVYLSSVYFPDLQDIGDGSFGCYSMDFAYLPNLSSIFGDSFYGRTAKVVLGENPPMVYRGEIGDNDVTFIVPAGSKSKYEADERWKTQKIVEEDNQIEITATGDDGNIAEGNMTYSRIVLKGNYATFCLPFEIDVPDEFDKVYVPASVALLHDNGKLCVLFKESKSTTIAAKTPFIAKIKNGNFLTLSNTASVASTSVSTNPDEQEIKIFKYKSGSKVLMQDNTYTLKWGGTLKDITSSDVTGLMGFNSKGSFGTVSKQLAYRAYLTKNTNSSAAKEVGVTAMFLGEDEETVTAIMNLTTEEVTEIHPQGVYTLDGKRLPSEDNLPKGIYIINGKKVVK